MIYLDNSATSFPKPSVVTEKISQFISEGIASINRRGYAHFQSSLEELVFETRQKLIRLLGADTSDLLIFTLNATDAINLALGGLLRQGDHVITSCFEHSAVAATLEALSNNRKISISRVSPAFRDSFRITAADLERALRPETKLVVIAHSSNVTGNVLIDSDVGEFCNAHKLLFIVDGSQSVGSVTLDVQELKCDCIAFSGHKSLMGPVGVGCLLVREGLALQPHRYGGIGARETKRMNGSRRVEEFEPGTPNTIGIIGMHAALTLIEENGLQHIIQKKSELIRILINDLSNIPGVKLYGDLKADVRLPSVSFNIGSLSAVDDVGPMLHHSFDIVTRAGIHCAPWMHEYLGTLPNGTVRASLGMFNSTIDILRLVEAIKEIATLEEVCT